MNKLVSGKLSEDVLDKITGGVDNGQNSRNREDEEYLYTVERKCSVCKKKMTFYVFSGGRAFCSGCDQRIDV